MLCFPCFLAVFVSTSPRRAQLSPQDFSTQSTVQTHFGIHGLRGAVPTYTERRGQEPCITRCLFPWDVRSSWVARGITAGRSGVLSSIAHVKEGNWTKNSQLGHDVGRSTRADVHLFSALYQLVLVPTRQRHVNNAQNVIRLSWTKSPS